MELPSCRVSTNLVNLDDTGLSNSKKGFKCKPIKARCYQQAPHTGNHQLLSCIYSSIINNISSLLPFFEFKKKRLSTNTQMCCCKLVELGASERINLLLKFIGIYTYSPLLEKYRCNRLGEEIELFFWSRRWRLEWWKPDRNAGTDGRPMAKP